MTRIRIFKMMLVLFLWTSITAFQPLSTADRLVLTGQTFSITEPSIMAAPAGFGKTSPANNATDIGALSVKFTWAKSATTGVTYSVCVQTKLSCPKNKWVLAGIDASTVTVSGLRPRTVYYWQVRAVDGTGTTLANSGTWWKFTTLALPGGFSKATPANLAVNQPTSSLVLTWGVSSATDYYEYCLDEVLNTTCDANWVRVNTNSATINGLDANKTYYWQVRANNESGTTNANGGTWWQFNTNSLPGAFNKLSPANGAGGQPFTSLNLSWSASVRAASYEYCIDTVNDGACNNPSWINAGNVLQATVTGLQQDTPYFWQVRAVNTGGLHEAGGGWWSFTTLLLPPGSFTKSNPGNDALATETTLSLAWASSTGKNITYAYCYDTTGNGACDSGTWIDVATLQTVQLSGLAYGTTYYWQVRATNLAGRTDADAGSWYHFTTKIAPPGSFSKSAPGKGDIQVSLNPALTWGISAGTGIDYRYCLDTTADDACDNNNWISTGTATQVALTGLPYDTTFYWQVQAHNATATVEASGGWSSFTTKINPPGPFTKGSPAQNTQTEPTNPSLSWVGATGKDITYEYCYYAAGSENRCGTTSPDWITVNQALTASLTGLTYDKIYWWQVRAVNATATTYANGGNFWSFKVRKAPAAGFVKNYPEANQIDVPLAPMFEWGASPTSGVTYEICLDQSADTVCDPLPNGTGWVSAGANTSFTFVDTLARATTYYWQVRAITQDLSTTTYADSELWSSFTTLVVPPSSTDQGFSSPEDTLFNGALVANGAQGHSLTYELWGEPPSSLQFGLNADGTFTFMPEQNFNGQVSFAFEVSDGANPPVGPFYATITVTAVNDPPVLNSIQNRVVSTGHPVTLTTTATDPDIPYGDHLLYSLAETAPEGASIDPDTGIFTWTPIWTPAHPGPYTITVRVTDTDASFDEGSVEILVSPRSIYLPFIFRGRP